ncbi:hypothetical protein GCM10022247_34910 [Allokutzneria multivorans]|uniref:DUF4913 domain-containing protein n=1 Tax=Allokutzneria multivorans TaxID=1142134 RepID=A0ABP7SC24_9PSEU
MSEHERMDALERRVGAVEAEQLELVEQTRRANEASQRNAVGLDELEDVLTEMALAARDPDALNSALALDTTTSDVADPEHADIAAPDGSAPISATTAQQDQDEPAADVTPQLLVLHEWVGHHLAPWARKVTVTGEGGGIRWCRRWWEHPDAVVRITALFLAYSELCTEDSAVWLSVFLRDHMDPHVGVLTSPIGPFNSCTPTRHSSAVEQLGQDSVPAASAEQSP